LLFSAAPELVEYAQGIYRQRSHTSGVLRQILDRYQKEGIIMPYTFEDFDVDYILEHLPELPQERQREVVERLPPEVRQKLLQALPWEHGLANLWEKRTRKYRDNGRAPGRATPRKPRRKKP